MKKIIILSYFFPPSNLTAANRISNWYKYFPKNNIHPIVVTRNWTGKELNAFQQQENSGDKVLHKIDKDAEIYYLPYVNSVRDKFFIKGQSNKLFSIISKILTFIFLIGQNFSINFIPYKNLYFKTLQLLKEDPSIKTVIISGNPFEQFFFGYLLKKKNPQIKWIADYRDDWTTTELIKKRSLLQKIIHYLEKKSEMKWLSNVDLFTSVSPYYVEKIGKFIKKDGSVVFNGFNEELLSLGTNAKQNSFIITYNGSLYQTQKIEIFLESIIKLIEKYAKQINIKVNFPGIEHNITEALRVKKIISGYETYFELSGRIQKEKVIAKQLESDILLMVAHENIKGVTSSKIFEYIGLRIPILLCPSDNDVLNEIIESIPECYSANDSNTCFQMLDKLVQQKLNNLSLTQYSKNSISKYSSSSQVKRLAELIKEL